MLTIFNVSQVDFLSDTSDKEILRFSPTRYLKKSYTDRELIKRIFTEDIIVNDEPPAPVYPEIIQQLIDAEAKTADDINAIIKSYPYEVASAIFDYKYNLWTKVGSGTITRDGDTYQFSNAGVQQTNFITQLNGHKVQFNAEIQLLDVSTAQLLFVLYNNLSGTTTYPFINVQYLVTGDNPYHFFPSRRTANNGAITRGITTKTAPAMTKTNKPIKLEITIDTDGSIAVTETPLPYQYSTTHIARIDTASSINLKNIRIAANAAATAGFSNNIQYDKLQILYDNQIISQWNQ